jgi:hypothetical protein
VWDVESTRYVAECEVMLSVDGVGCGSLREGWRVLSDVP